VTVRAQQDAFLGFGPQRAQAQPKSAGADHEPLLVRVRVMKLKRSRMAVVPAGGATAPGFGDEDQLHAPAAARDGFGSAAPAPVAPFTVEHECRRSVRGAVPHHEELTRGFRLRIGWASADTVPSSQSVPPEPMSNGGLTPIHLGSDFGNRVSGPHQRLQSLP
jgi:hypothetical protein